MVPDKIYVGIRDMGSGYSVDISFSPEERHSEYIRKDALLEWLNEARAVPHNNAIARDLAFQEVIEKINSL